GEKVVEVDVADLGHAGDHALVDRALRHPLDAFARAALHANAERTRPLHQALDRRAARGLRHPEALHRLRPRGERLLDGVNPVHEHADAYWTRAVARSFSPVFMQSSARQT